MYRAIDGVPVQQIQGYVLNGIGDKLYVRDEESDAIYPFRIVSMDRQRVCLTPLGSGPLIFVDWDSGLLYREIGA